MQPRNNKIYSETLLLAAKEGRADIVQSLLETKIDPNITSTETGATALGWAAKQGHTAILTTLLKAKADPDRVENIGKTPLSYAVERNHAKMVIALLEAKADPNIIGDITNGIDSFFTPLNIAAFQENSELVKVLLEAKADLNRTSLVGLPLLKDLLKPSKYLTILSTITLSKKEKLLLMFLEANVDHDFWWDKHKCTITPKLLNFVTEHDDLQASRTSLFKFVLTHCLTSLPCIDSVKIENDEVPGAKLFLTKYSRDSFEAFLLFCYYQMNHITGRKRTGLQVLEEFANRNNPLAIFLLIKAHMKIITKEMSRGENCETRLLCDLQSSFKIRQYGELFINISTDKMKNIQTMFISEDILNACKKSVSDAITESALFVKEKIIRMGSQAKITPSIATRLFKQASLIHPDTLPLNQSIIERKEITSSSTASTHAVVMATAIPIATATPIPMVTATPLMDATESVMYPTIAAPWEASPTMASAAVSRFFSPPTTTVTTATVAATPTLAALQDQRDDREIAWAHAFSAMSVPSAPIENEENAPLIAPGQLRRRKITDI